MDAAGASDSSGIYRGRQAELSYFTGDFPDSSEWFWRIDEVDSGGGVVKGRVWSFSTGAEAVDLYALGTMLFELLTGKVPFPDLDTVTTIRAIRENAPPDLAPEVPAELASVTRRLLEKDPEARYAKAREVAVALEVLADRIAADQPVR